MGRSYNRQSWLGMAAMGLGPLVALGLACLSATGCKSDGLTDLESRGVTAPEVAAIRALIRGSELPAERFAVTDVGASNSGCCQVEVEGAHVIAIRIRLGQVGSLAPLKGLPHLRRADFTGNRLAPPFELDNCGLRELNLYGNPVDGFDGLSQCKELTKLQLSGEQLKSFGGIEALGSLKELGVESSGISDLAPLAKLAQLTSLSVNRSPVSRVTGLSGHAKLRRLSLQGTQLDDASGIHDLPALEVLHVGDTPLRSFDGLAAVPKLSRITANGSKVSDLGVLTSLPGLRELEVKNTQVATLPDGLKKLKQLSVDGTPLQTGAAPSAPAVEPVAAPSAADDDG